jgi:hypothetical protein
MPSVKGNPVNTLAWRVGIANTEISRRAVPPGLRTLASRSHSVPTNRTGGKMPASQVAAQAQTNPSNTSKSECNREQQCYTRVGPFKDPCWLSRMICAAQITIRITDFLTVTGSY